MTETKRKLDLKLAGLVESTAEGQVLLPTGLQMPLVATSNEGSRSIEEWVKTVKESWERDEVDKVLVSSVFCNPSTRTISEATLSTG
jgi:hypothetical protein